MVLVQMQTSRSQHTTSRTRSLQNTRVDTHFLQLFITNLHFFNNQHNYNFDHIWNTIEIGIQVGRQFRARILAKRGSNVIYNTIPKC
jgi:hypothetical protein